MGDADMDIILRSIKDPTALYLRQHLTARASRVVDPPEELPSGQQFLRQLPEQARQAEEMAFIMDIFSHAAQAHEHLSEVCANVTALAKITDKTTLMSVINGAVWPLEQLNIPKRIFKSHRRQEGSNIRRREERKSEKRWCCPSPTPLA